MVLLENIWRLLEWSVVTDLSILLEQAKTTTTSAMPNPVQALRKYPARSSIAGSALCVHHVAR